jgi:hypothetical protein
VETCLLIHIATTLDRKGKVAYTALGKQGKPSRGSLAYFRIGAKFATRNVLTVSCDLKPKNVET